MGTLHEDLCICTCMAISRSIILSMKNSSDKCCRENQNINFMANNFFPENRAVYERICKNIVESDRPQMAV